MILFLEPDVDWVQDGDRSEIIASDREKYSEMLKSYYTRNGYSFKTISGDYNTRFDLAVKYVKELFEAGK